MSFNPLSDVVGQVAKGLDSLFTSDEERLQAKLALKQQLNKPYILQALANIEEAKHPSVFVSGWRPALAWLCIVILAWTWIVRDLVIIVLELTGQGVVVDSLPVTSAGEVITLLLCLLGLGGVRSVEKMTGVARKQ